MSDDEENEWINDSPSNWDMDDDDPHPEGDQIWVRIVWFTGHWNTAIYIWERGDPISEVLEEWVDDTYEDWSGIKYWDFEWDYDDYDRYLTGNETAYDLGVEDWLTIRLWYK
ncbi:hypothetical protein CI109_102988 [Kwoniella shandongensis]|uniref:Uncharacterized protein n=1 Tax=Kwoniella shandongensis TaxID=1734106 RepID=A0A5M6C8B4_9TREE|nr:uncharacterized protein CI109_000175 [Kwoniella shandongensis]KAA5531334.1 hypothetical protein CI109_000175 [Kwoniella shandongensis]